MFAQKTKRAPKVEVGTRSTDASTDEWLQVCSYALYCTCWISCLML